MAEKYLDPKVGYLIGWDHAVHRIWQPNEANNKEFMAGFNDGLEKVSKKPADRFIRKHLLLRLNAYKRGRIFDDSVTPEFIRMIDEEKCPITQVRLTHGTLEDSDWSVDRIHNDCAYVRGNLVVVSTKANVCKGSLSMEEILDLACGKRSVDPKFNSKEETGLNIFEWRRWFLISSLMIPRDANGEHIFSFGVAPAIAMPPRHTPPNISIIMQFAIANKVEPWVRLDLYGSLTKAMTAKERQGFALLLKKAERVSRNTPGRPLDIWHNMNLYGNFCDFFDSMTLDRINEIWSSHDNLIKGIRKSKAVDDEEDFGVGSSESWGISSGGYAEPEVRPSRKMGM